MLNQRLPFLIRPSYFSNGHVPTWPLDIKDGVTEGCQTQQTLQAFFQFDIHQARADALFSTCIVLDCDASLLADLR